MHFIHDYYYFAEVFLITHASLGIATLQDTQIVLYRRRCSSAFPAREISGSSERSMYVADDVRKRELGFPAA